MFTRLKQKYHAGMAALAPEGPCLLRFPGGKSALVCRKQRQFTSGNYESALGEVFAELAGSCTVFYDIGAHIGFWSLFVHAHQKEATVVAFEPNPEVRRWLELHFKMNQMLAPSSVEGIAIGDISGLADFSFSEECSTGSLSRKVCEVNGRFYEKPIQTVSVPLSTLDAFVAQRGLNPDLLKIDCEGHELRVLVGATETLRSRPTLLIEVHPPQLSLLGDSVEALELRLRSLGYHWEKISELPNGIFTLVARGSAQLL